MSLRFGCFGFGLTTLVAISLTSGCSNAPSRVSAPSISAGTASAAAITKYDKNADGGLDDTELKAVPGILRAKARFDKNGDGKVTADEIATRIGEWQGSKIGLTQYSLMFTLDGQPLNGATVKFVPEDWLGAAVQAGTGTTDATGRVNLAIAPGDLQPNEAGLNGMRLGVYKIEITHPMMQIPPKFNTATEIGVEIAHDDPNIGRDSMPLTSR